MARICGPLALAILVSAGCQAPVAVQLGTWSFKVSTLSSAPATVVPASRQIPRATSVQVTPTAAPSPTPARRVPAASAPDRIIAPAIGLDAAVTAVRWRAAANGASEWEISDDAAGFLAGSALPGAAGNTVISGHHNIKAKVFEDLHELKPGDEVTLRASGREYRYVVVDSFILPERGVPDEQRMQNARWIGPTADERLTLVTCWPASDNSHRLIVIARPS